MNDRIAIESLAMDLKRVALGLHRGSFKMAERFTIEAFSRIDEVKDKTDKYLGKLLLTTRSLLQNQNPEVAEDILMYSILIQNYAILRMK